MGGHGTAVAAVPLAGEQQPPAAGGPQDGDRLLMLNQGQVVMDRAGEEKARTSIDEVMETFNRIALETGA